MTKFKRNFLPLFALLTLSLSLTAQKPSDEIYKSSVKREACYLGAGVFTTLTGSYLKSKTNELSLSQLNLREINKVDRIATKYSSDLAGNLSNVTLFTALGLPTVLLAGKETGQDFGKIALLYVETLLINQGFTDIFKSSFLRPRPYVFDEGLDPATILTTNDRASFLSGHTSSSAAASFFFARVFNDYYPESKYRPYVWGLAISVPAITGFLRVRSGKHYPTDVIAGYILGATTGFLIPRQHTKPIGSKGWRLSSKNGVSLGYHF